jgi:co-chaperonin GroES (HSP10)
MWRTLHTEWLWVYRGHPVKVNEWSQEIPVPPGVFFVEEGEARIKADGVEHIIIREDDVLAVTNA